MAEHWMCVGSLLVMGMLLVLALRMLDHERAQHSAQLDRLMVLQKSETLDQFAAVEARMQRARLEDARGLAAEGRVEKEAGERPVARNRKGALYRIWNRAPTVVPSTDAKE